ncbi:MAG: 50S ribosomal protein L15 [Candidatus Nealsonbacteria bacterium RBG_13_36_15]|uniref:Large ribosomal subunit protein uL15 n=1 Tax=Candidatus Nealsonbacteria bacterium RBG_13_36_15 TaxID=1801660 RepID=A0A1G2DVT9_9BACT|nr:MAG: 50S ribosomal protein L15 [Candidatus Nealsonbacteria bacterium RBG_13_36_15]
MQLHQLTPKHKSKRRKRIGRGGKRGTYSGRGVKGQKSRSGRRLQPAIRQIIKRYPKLRGYRFNIKHPKPAVINLETLEKKFKSSEIVSPKNLLEKRLIRRMEGRTPEIKILGKGKLTKKLIIENCQVSKKAKESIEKAGGNIK